MNLTELTLGQRIAALRKQQGLTQEALAQKLSITPQAVSKWENDLSCPDIMTLPSLAELLAVTTDTLLTGAESFFAPAKAQKKPEELVICISILSDDGARFRYNLPFRAFRIAARFSMLSITYNNGGTEDNILQHIDFDAMIRLVESGVTGKLLERSDDGELLTIWTE